jgi:hypothetical protein
MMKIHPICIPIPRSVTWHTVHWGLQVTCGTLTLIDALEAYIYAPVGQPPHTRGAVAAGGRAARSLQT